MIPTITPEQIRKLCEQIASKFHPQRIVLFGSHAYGNPGPFSDADLLVVMPFEGSPLQQAARILTRINPPVGGGFDHSHTGTGARKTGNTRQFYAGDHRARKGRL